MNERLQHWVSKISDEELPAFAHTARSLAFVSRENDSSANDLSNVILHDSAMTARVLRIANSAHFNPTGNSIETVSYATVILGFEQVRNLALTIAMIDTVLGSKPQQQVQKEMVSAYHAAVQAQRLAKKADPKNLEAVYIGALLNRLGPIMFWCFPFGKGDDLLDAYQETDIPERAERKILGFSLDNLTTALVSEWSLSEMLEKALRSKSIKDEQEKAISIGFGIANNISRGWTSKIVGEKIHSAAKYLEVPLEEAKDHIYASARAATEGLKSFGFPETHSLLPPEKEATEVKPATDQSKIALELRILRQLTHMLGENMDLNQVLMAVLEGIYRVLDMEQVVFALIDRKNHRLQAKYMIGKQRDAILNTALKGTTSGKYLKSLINKGETRWVTETSRRSFNREDLDPLLIKLEATEFLLHPILLNNNPIGVVYAARSSKLSEHDFETFGHLADHSTLAFKLLSQKK